MASLTAVTSIVGILVLGLFAVPSYAQDGRETQEKLAPVMLVLDASDSMNGDDPSGGSKLDAAKSALRKMIDQLPAEAEVGLTVYGSEAEVSDEQASCADIKTAFEVAPMDRDGMRSAVDDIDARGWTPIGGSLEHAAAELPDEGPRSIVLISDGAETCAPPEACEAAKSLGHAGVELKMHAVGFDIDEAGRNELECIAEAGDGDYVDAPDAGTLEEELPKIAERALRVYESEGIRVRGTETLNKAPELRPGQYLDRIGTGAARYYRVDVPDGMGVHAAATLIRPADEGQGGTAASYVDLKLINRNDDQCDSDRVVDSDMNWTSHNTPSVYADISEDADCYTGEGRYFLRVERGDSGRAEGERDIEILVAFEPPARGEQTSSTEEVPFAEPSGQAQEAVGGSSFNKATELTGSGIYTDRIGYGEAAFYRVPLDWGQGLSYQVHFGDSGTQGITNMLTRVYNPVRANGYDLGATGAYGGRSTELGPIQTAPVYHGNRESGSIEAEVASLAGDYYIMVQLAHPRMDDTPIDIDFELTLNITGQPSDPPQYAKVKDYPAEVMYDLVANTAAVRVDGVTTTSRPALLVGIGAGVAILGLGAFGLRLWLRSRRSGAA
ncbi:Ca-activated chloride channel family protein [Tamaricihabitans halophyticus]|uniref:Ca-activated chloride channel family protein n=1 Tax=Tamaricihabitans halophyticus TaxID=1262583 RepID=A0A4R2QMF2_9PSEU|nr:VWA domain-containing protein [Tamaricihabitans halophyticus]TCP50743.1 Ca-activated chloride channel family protein [Tamaricihabitans halophyticus]